MSNRTCQACGYTNLGDTSQRNLLGDELIGNSAEFSNLLSVEDMHPSLRVVSIVFSLPDSFPCDLFGEC